MLKLLNLLFVEAVDCCRLHYVLYRALVLLKQLNLLLKLLIVVGYYELLRALVLLKLLIVEAIVVESVSEAVDC